MMMVEKEDLGLSLSLSFGVSSSNQSCLQLNLMPCSSSPSPFGVINKASSGHGDGRWFIDVNCSPEEGGVSSPNSTISSDEEDAENSRKKLRLSKDQSALLEESFKDHNTLNPKQKMGLAKRLGLRPRQVEVWFQNRRARTKLKQTEVDCEFLKRCSENLREENRRLQKEVQELRALKLSPHLYMQMTPPTTLTICPSCDRSVALPAHPRPVTFTQSSAAPAPIPIPHCRPFDLLHSHSHSRS